MASQDTIRALERRGLSPSLAEHLTFNNYNLTTLRKASYHDLKRFLTTDEIQLVIDAVGNKIITPEMMLKDSLIEKNNNLISVENWIHRIGFKNKIDNELIDKLTPLFYQVSEIYLDESILQEIEDINDKIQDLEYVNTQLVSIVNNGGKAVESAMMRIERYSLILYSLEKEKLVLEGFEEERQKNIKYLETTALMIALDSLVGMSSEDVILEVYSEQLNRYKSVDEVVKRTEELKQIIEGKSDINVKELFVTSKKQISLKDKIRMEKVLKVKGYNNEEIDLIINWDYTEEEILQIRDTGKRPEQSKISYIIHGDVKGDVIQAETHLRDSVVSRSSIGGGDLMNELELLGYMNKKGLITDEQFNAAKEKLIK